MEKRRRVAIIGSTGSVGTQALDVISRHPDRFEVVALAAGRNVKLLSAQIAQFAPPIVSVGDQHAVVALAECLTPEGVDARPSAPTILNGADGLFAVACESGADVVLASSDGSVAFDAIFAAVDRGLDIALANKELIAAAGHLLVERASKTGSRLLPVDSEHSAIFQCLQGSPENAVAGIMLTASGGPFWTWPKEQMLSASLQDALAHPTWSMGHKISIDSATLMNKGLEVIEASQLFGIPGDRVHVLVHRSSVAHGFVVFRDGNVLCQIAKPDMRLPIGYALAFPNRLTDRPEFDPLDAIGGSAAAYTTSLTFERPDFERFPCLRLAYEALAEGGTAPAVLSAANEVAVAAFIAGEIGFSNISTCVEESLEKTKRPAYTLDGVREADSLARLKAREYIVALHSVE